MNHLISLIILFGAAAAEASSIDVLTGARVSISSTQSILGAPPLPSLESNTGLVFIFQGGYLTGKAIDSSNGGASGYSGNFYGKAAGIGFSSRTFGNFSFFGLFVASQMDGEIAVTSSDGTSITYFREMKVQSMAAVAGISYRFIGEGRSPFAAGVFVGPTWMSLKSRFHVDAPYISYISPDYTAEPKVTGVMAGLQLKWRLNHYLIAPYALYMGEVSNHCKGFSTPNPADQWPACEGDPYSADLPASFSAYGINLGYRGFSFNAFSQTQNANSAAMKAIEVHQYQLSYSAGLDI